MARNLNGSTDHITIGTSSKLNPTGDATWSIWFYPTASTSYGTIWSRGSAGGTTGEWTIFFGDGGRMAYYFNAGPPEDPCTHTLTLNTWHHLCAVFVASGTTLQPYLDGVTDHANSNTGASASVSVSANFGVTAGGGGPGQGNIADAAIWAAALTIGEVTALAQGARPNTIRPASLNFWMPLDGKQSPEPDYSGNGNNGTLSGTSLFVPNPPINMLTPRWPQVLSVSAPPPPTTAFRRSLSSLGTRTGSRQLQLGA